MGLEALFSRDRHDLRSAVEARLPELAWVAERLAPAAIEPAPDASPIDEARERVVAADATDSIDAMSAALAALSRLSTEQRRDLVKAEPFR